MVLWSSRSPLICSLTGRCIDKGGGTLQDRDAQGVIPHMVNALRVLHRRVQRIVAEILRFFSENGRSSPFFLLLLGWREVDVLSAQRIYAHWTKTGSRALTDIERSESAVDESLVTTEQRRARSVSHFDEDLSESFSEEGIHANGNGRDRSGSRDSADGVTRERSTAVVTTHRARSVSLSDGDRLRRRRSPVSRRTIMGGETVCDLNDLAGSYSETIVQDLEGIRVTSNQRNSDTQDVTFRHEKMDEELDITR